MKHRVKKTLRELTTHFGVKVKYVGYFGAETHGKLMPREKIILINAHKSRPEHVFTLLHELGHYVLHVLNPYRKFHPRWCDLNWRVQFMANLCSTIRRYMRFNFRKEAGREWEADTWALCAFWLLACRFGAWEEFSAFLKHHPEKRWKFALVRTVSIFQDGRTRIKTFVRHLKLAFKAG